MRLSTPPSEVAGCSNRAQASATRAAIRGSQSSARQTHDKELELVREVRRKLCLPEQNGKARRPTRHLPPLAEQLARVGLQARVPHVLDDAARSIEVRPGVGARERREPLRERGRCCGLAGDAEGEGAQGAQEEPRVEGADVGPGVGPRVPAAKGGVADGQRFQAREGETAKGSAQRQPVLLGLDAEGTGERVRVPAKVLCAAVC